MIKKLLLIFSAATFATETFATETIVTETIAKTSPDPANTAFIMICTALVLFMTIPGLSLFYGGLVRQKNVLSVLLQCFAITCVVSVLWLICGYSLSFGNGGSLNSVIGGLDKMFLRDLLKGTIPDGMDITIPETTFSTFQMTFAIITPALIVGAFAERIKFSAMLIFSSIWLILVYAPVCHWVWGNGWLQKMGLIDLAGGTVVHVTAGTAALVAALVIGNRKGFPKSPIPPHNLTMTITGAGMLWVGWFGFNGGSFLTADSNASMAIMTTHMSAAAGALTWMAIEWIKFGKPSALGAVTGMVAGLGTITPASGVAGPAGGLAIGMIAGFVCFNCTMFLKQKLKIDDSLDVSPVHGVGGIIGTIMAAIFASTNLGIFSGSGSLGKSGYAEEMTMIKQLGVQFTGVAATIAFTAVMTFIILKITGMITGGLRVDTEDETRGLDLSSHEETGYNFTDIV
ncbi:MAG: ammonium transporter [Gammaproteobacteria bacterium]|nr:MAG: ammonium transporter [Gammaproteobacteria bacterium]